MDRRGGKKVKQHIAAFFAFLLLFLAGVYGYFLAAARLFRRQQEELSILYPELAEELLDNAAYYEALFFEKGAFFLILLLVLILLFAIVLFLVWNKNTRQELECTRKNVQAVCEQLEQFQKGEFKQNSVFSEPEDEAEQGVWLRLSELLRELGHYFEDKREQLSSEENSTKALITDISHQLKTPLASLRLCYELTRAENLTEEERREFIAKEEQEILRLELLLEELVKLSRLENHMIQIKAVPAGIKKTISDAVSQVIMKAQGKEIELQVELTEDVMVLHDTKWTAEVLINVLDNAVKYSEPHTLIILRVTPLPSNVLLEIDDEGMGIPEEELYHVFKRFYRGKEAGKRVKEGAGVGLYLARSILERQGGTITVKRKLAGGTVFSIVLPRAKE